MNLTWKPAVGLQAGLSAANADFLSRLRLLPRR